jgi:hypothetical protein
MIKKFTGVLGAVLLGVGLWGMATGGHDHELIVFGINATHNMVHIASGLLGLVLSFLPESFGRFYLLLFGAVYGVVTAAGFAGVTQVVEMLNLNTADNFLHLAITAGCFLVGLRIVR